MKAIYCYKFMDTFWKPKDEYFWKLAKLSVNHTKKYYTTVLYADRKTKSLFRENGIEFNEFVDMTREFDKVRIHSYCMPKILSMIKQTTPYVVMDLDIILFEKIQPTNSVTFGFKEVDTSIEDSLEAKKWQIPYVEEYYENYYNKFRLNVKDTPVKFDWCVFPNNSLVFVNNPYIVSKTYQTILDMLGEDVFKIPPVYSAQFYEQFLFYNYLKYYNTDVGFVYDKKPPRPHYDKKENDFNHLFSNKFLHLESYHRDEDMHTVIDYLEQQWENEKKLTNKNQTGLI